jgi:hypothetical protein
MMQAALGSTVYSLALKSCLPSIRPDVLGDGVQVVYCLSEFYAHEKFIS